MTSSKDPVSSAAKTRFHKDPDDLVTYKHATLSRFGQDKGPIKRNMVDEISDVEGRAVIVARAADQLDKLRRRMSVTHSMYCAGREFKDMWAIAGYSSIRTSNLSDAGGGGMSAMDYLDRTRRAREMIRNTQELLGGTKSLKWQAVHHCLALDQSMRSLAGGGGRKVSMWNGMIISALEDMARDYDRRMRVNKRGKIQKA